MSDFTFRRFREVDSLSSRSHSYVPAKEKPKKRKVDDDGMEVLDKIPDNRNKKKILNQQEALDQEKNRLLYEIGVIRRELIPLQDEYQRIKEVAYQEEMERTKANPSYNFIGNYDRDEQQELSRKIVRLQSKSKKLEEKARYLKDETSSRTLISLRVEVAKLKNECDVANQNLIDTEILIQKYKRKIQVRRAALKLPKYYNPNEYIQELKEKIRSEQLQRVLLKEKYEKELIFNDIVKAKYGSTSEIDEKTAQKYIKLKERFELAKKNLERAKNKLIDNYETQANEINDAETKRIYLSPPEHRDKHRKLLLTFEDSSSNCTVNPPKRPKMTDYIATRNLNKEKFEEKQQKTQSKSDGQPEMSEKTKEFLSKKRVIEVGRFNGSADICLISKVFGEFGEIESISSKGDFVEIIYEEHSDAKNALIKKNGSDFQNQIIVVNWGKMLEPNNSKINNIENKRNEFKEQEKHVSPEAIDIKNKDKDKVNDQDKKDEECRAANSEKEKYNIENESQRDEKKQNYDANKSESLEVIDDSSSSSAKKPKKSSSASSSKEDIVISESSDIEVKADHEDVSKLNLSDENQNTNCEKKEKQLSSNDNIFDGVPIPEPAPSEKQKLLLIKNSTNKLDENENEEEGNENVESEKVKYAKENDSKLASDRSEKKSDFFNKDNTTELHKEIEPEKTKLSNEIKSSTKDLIKSSSSSEEIVENISVSSSSSKTSQKSDSKKSGSSSSEEIIIEDSTSVIEESEKGSLKIDTNIEDKKDPPHIGFSPVPKPDPKQAVKRMSEIDRLSSSSPPPREISAGPEISRMSDIDRLSSVAARPSSTLESDVPSAPSDIPKAPPVLLSGLLRSNISKMLNQPVAFVPPSEEENPTPLNKTNNSSQLSARDLLNNIESSSSSSSSSLPPLPDITTPQDPPQHQGTSTISNSVPSEVKAITKTDEILNDPQKTPESSNLNERTVEHEVPEDNNTDNVIEDSEIIDLGESSSVKESSSKSGLGESVEDISIDSDSSFSESDSDELNKCTTPDQIKKESMSEVPKISPKIEINFDKDVPMGHTPIPHTDNGPPGVSKFEMPSGYGDKKSEKNEDSDSSSSTGNYF